ncbi:hypothetical protein HanRHA438_Chr04g0176731 [Helianthus annuus]|nr:hypothetical protein HanRHA438_Chr04g0176731 [Helianthus annuus]
MRQRFVYKGSYVRKDHRYSAGACMEEDRCGTQIAACYVKLETFELML